MGGACVSSMGHRVYRCIRQMYATLYLEGFDAVTALEGAEGV